jgi:hypothetical protein
VKIVVPEDGTIEFAQTMANEHHYSSYESAERVLEQVVGETMPIPKEIEMTKYFHLWHWKSGNLLAEYHSAEEAIDALSEAIEEKDLPRVSEYGIVVFEDGTDTLYAEGDKLIKLVADRMHAMSR